MWAHSKLPKIYIALSKNEHSQHLYTILLNFRYTLIHRFTETRNDASKWILDDRPKTSLSDGSVSGYA